VAVRERDKLSGAFAAAGDVATVWDRLETWSQLVADALGLAPGPQSGEL
jgi:predicted NUDIX family phosphoesterase